MDQKQIQDKLERIQREVNQVIRGKENVESGFLQRSSVAAIY